MFPRYYTQKNRVDSQTAGWTTQNMMLQLFGFSLLYTEEQSAYHLLGNHVITNKQFDSYFIFFLHDHTSLETNSNR